MNIQIRLAFFSGTNQNNEEFMFESFHEVNDVVRVPEGAYRVHLTAYQYEVILARGKHGPITGSKQGKGCDNYLDSFNILSDEITIKMDGYNIIASS